MGAVAIQQMADRVAALMEERLRIRGTGLDIKLRRGGRLLPRKVRAAAEALSEAAAMAYSPKLSRLIDDAVVADNYDLCVRYLGGIDLADRRRGAVIGVAASIAGSLLVVGVIVLAILGWRDLI